MVNRIAYWWKEVQDWKKNFDKFLRTNGISSGREILKEELKKYNTILGRSLRNMTSAERITRKHLIAERNKLFRQIYPSVAVRFFKNFQRLTGMLFRKFSPGTSMDKMPKRSIEMLAKVGLTDEADSFGKDNFKTEFSESLNKDEIIDIKLKLQEMGGKPIIQGYDASLTSANGELRRVSISDELPIDKFKARELLHGRAVNIKDGIWIVPDLNDRNSKGYIKLREVNVPDLSIKDKIKEIRGLKLSPVELQKLTSDLAGGKRVQVHLLNKNSKSALEFEIDPIRRELIFFQNGIKTQIDQLANNRTSKNSKVIELNKNQVKRANLKL